MEEQGKLLKLPCAVGDTVYSFSAGKVITFRIDSFVVFAGGIGAMLVRNAEYEYFTTELYVSDFGKKWFATQKEAEVALKEMENKQ